MRENALNSLIFWPQTWSPHFVWIEFNEGQNVVSFHDREAVSEMIYTIPNKGLRKSSWRFKIPLYFLKVLFNKTIGLVRLIKKIDVLSEIIAFSAFNIVIPVLLHYGLSRQTSGIMS